MRLQQGVIAQLNNNSIRNMENEDLKYSFRQFLIPIEPSHLHNSRITNKTINRDILHAIGDQAEPPSSPSFAQRVIGIYQKIGRAIRPSNIYLLCWSFILICIILFYILQLGLLIAFKQLFWQDQLNHFLAMYIIFIIILICDILLSPLKCYYDEGVLITDVTTIYHKYMGFQFWIDVIGVSLIVIPLISGELEWNWIKVLWLGKIYTASRINIEFQRVTQLSISLSTIYLVLKLVVFCYIYSHFSGIGFYMVSMYVYNSNYYGPNTPNLCWVYNAWAFYQMAIILSWQQIYVYIMYYSIAVTTTIAYGDITPKNPIECLYTIFALITVTLVFGYIMTEILRLLINVFSYNFDRRFLHYELVSKLKNEKIQQSIQIKIRAHSEEIDREQQYRNRKVEESVMNFLPSQPLYGLLAVIYQDFLQELGFYFIQPTNLALKPTHTKSLFLQKFMKDIIEERHYIGDLLYASSELDQSLPNGHCVYFFTKEIYAEVVMLGAGAIPVLKAGELDARSNKRSNCFEVARTKKMFGEAQYLNGRERSHWAFCLSNCVIFIANRHSLISHYHLLTQQEKQMVFARMENASQSKCLFCQENHDFLKCHYLFINQGNFHIMDQKAPRKKKVQRARTRLKTQSSWTIYNKIKGTRIRISKEYKDKLLLNKADHSLFMEYELQQDNLIDEQQEFQTKLHQAQVMVEKIHDQFLQQIGKTPQNIEYDYVFQYRYYKPHNNVAQLAQLMQRGRRRSANMRVFNNIRQ